MWDEALHEIQAERRRQIEAEGYDVSHDDDHDGEEILSAAIVFLSSATGTITGPEVPHEWPWSAASWKPGPADRDYVRSGALAMAEAERRQRAGLPSNPATTHILSAAVDGLARLRGASAA
jgi:hypothetical protein